MNSRLTILLLAFLTLAASTVAGQESTELSRSFSVDKIKADIEYLASDELAGRSVADESIDVAARYIAGRMQEIGLDLQLFDGEPYQPFTVRLDPRAGRKEKNRVTLRVAKSEEEEGELTWSASLGDGMNPLAIGAPKAKLESPLVFAGYGITAPEHDYDDYRGIDANGATVIVIRKEPGVNDPNSPFGGTRNTSHAYFATKITNAVRHGAAAMILVNDRSSILAAMQNERSRINGETKRRDALTAKIESLGDEAAPTRALFEQKLTRVNNMIKSLQGDLKRAERGVLDVNEAGTQGPGGKSIPVVSLTRDKIDEILRATTGTGLEKIESDIDSKMQPQSELLNGATASIEIELRPNGAETSNVVGMLPGRGAMANETIVVGAHYDHVGMGGYGSLAPGTIAVHNGADDNASGVAMMLAIARALTTELRDQPSHRRIVFIAFSGEERGLLGSKHYVRNPRFPLESTVAMINLDMVGRIRDNELTVYGTASAPSFDALVEKANADSKFKLFKVGSGYGPSDHQSFYESKVPVLFFFTGLHNDYHRPSDDFDKIDFGGMGRITDTVLDVAFQLAIREERPVYAETENRVRIRRQMTTFLGVTLSDRDDHVVLSGLTPDGPAERGGLRTGDRLDRLGKRQVRTARDVLDWMRTRAPGDRQPVRVIRDGKIVELNVELQARP